MQVIKSDGNLICSTCRRKIPAGKLALKTYTVYCKKHGLIVIKNNLDGFIAFIEECIKAEILLSGAVEVERRRN